MLEIIERLVKTQIDGSYTRGSGWVNLGLETRGERDISKKSQVIQMLLAWGLHFENHWSNVFYFIIILLFMMMMLIITRTSELLRMSDILPIKPSLHSSFTTT